MVKSKYESHVLPYLDKIAQWAEQGATTKAIAKNLDVSYAVLRRYVSLGEGGDERYQALAASFARACKVPDDNVENALYRRACGIEYDETTHETKWDDKEEAFVEVCVKRVTKFIPPDPTSAMFWLTNRRPNRWSYKPQPNSDDPEKESGVVMLTPVMENPGPPEEKANG